ncbi:zinc finger, CCHC-type containing protein [Tanacetum coccineum]
MTDSRTVMEQYNELLGILGRFTQHKMNMDEAIQVSCIIDKLHPSWKDFKHTLKHQKEELTLVELGSHLRIEESLRVYNDNKGKRKHQDTKADPNKKSKVTCWKFGKLGNLKKDCKGGKVGNKVNGSGTNGLVDGSTNSVKGHNMFYKSLQVYYVTYVYEAYFVQDDDVTWWVDSRATAHHSKAVRFYVIKPNESVLINSIIESRDAIFNENRFSSVPKPSLRIPNATEDIGGSMVPEEVTKEEQWDEVFDQHSYCFNVGDDPKTFDEAIKSQDAAFWKEAINDEVDSIMGNNTWVLADLPPCCKPLGCKWIFKIRLKVDGTIEKFKARLVIQGFRQNLIIHQMDVKTTFLNDELDEEVYMNQPQGFIMLGNENKVCKLIKSLYGLKQAPKQ